MEFEVGLVSDLVDGQMKEVSFDGGKALLSRINGEFFATSHLCTHYKAPLVKGVLTSDGRVMCPWHGACFRVQTGDIEDAPLVAGIASFKVNVRSGKVFISATADEIKAGRKKAVCTKTKGTLKTAVVVGGGAAGLSASETLRTGGYGGRILLVSRETYLPIDRTKLSKSIKVDPSKIALRTAEDFERLDIDVLLGTEVTSVDPKTKQVSLSDGQSITYDQLVIATGGEPRVIPLENHKLKNIFVMRGVEDARNIERAVAAAGDVKPHVVVVGSSFIGMEAAASLSKLAHVTVIGMEQFPYERVLGPQVGAAMLKLNTQNGVVMEMQQGVDKYEKSQLDAEAVGAVLLKDGRSIKADFVVLGTGVIPKTDFLKSSGIPLDRDQGVSVTASLEVPNFEGIYVVGDVARYPYHLTGENVRVEHWNVAQNQGRLAAETILAKANDLPLPLFKHIPYFWTVQYGKSIRYAGHATSFDDIVIQGSVDLAADGTGLSFAAFYVRENQVVAVCSLAKDPVVSHASELMRLGLMPTVAAIKGGLDILTIPLLSPETFVVPPKEEKHDEINWVLFVALPLALVAVSGALFSKL